MATLTEEQKQARRRARRQVQHEEWEREAISALDALLDAESERFRAEVVPYLEAERQRFESEMAPYLDEERRRAESILDALDTTKLDTLDTTKREPGSRLADQE